MVLALAPPCVSVRLLGDAARLKLGGTLTVSERVVLAETLPEVPVMVTVALPAEAALEALKVSVVALLLELGLNDAVTPLGRPLAAKETLPLNPP